MFDRSFIEISGRLTAKILTKGTYAGSLAQDRLQRDPVMEILILQRSSQKEPLESTLAFLTSCSLQPFFGFSCQDCLFVVFLISLPAKRWVMWGSRCSFCQSTRPPQMTKVLWIWIQPNSETEQAATYLQICPAIAVFPDLPGEGL